MCKTSGNTYSTKLSEKFVNYILGRANYSQSARNYLQFEFSLFFLGGLGLSFLEK